MTGPHDFPFVEQCPDCHGVGFKIIMKVAKTPIERMDLSLPTWSRERCTVCEGRGRIIPSGWIEES